MTVHDILGRLRRVKKYRDGYIALCPEHHDHKCSLSIAEGADGRVLLKCHAGCETEQICKALGIEVKDLFFNNARKTTRTAKRVIATYNYLDEQGALLSQNCRTDPKGFFQRQPDGKGGWINNLDGVRRVLYHLPEVIAAQQVIVTEGEKDVETARSLGSIATCNAGGAGKWHDDHSECLRGKHVVVIPDADEPGRKHAQQVAASLHGKVASLRFFTTFSISG